MPVLVAFGSFVTTLLGGVAALRIGDRRHLVLGLAAGLMLGVVLFDLLPEALGEQPEHLFGVPVVMLAACISGSSPGSCSTWPPPTSSPRRTPAIPPASRSPAPSPAPASCGW